MLKKWIEHNFYELRQERQLYAKFVDFVKGIAASQVNGKWGDVLLQMITKESKLHRTSSAFYDAPIPKPLLPKKMDNIQTFWEIPAAEIARQLTCFEWSIFSQITPAELRSGGWGKPDKAETAPHVSAMTSWFNKVLTFLLFAPYPIVRYVTG